MFAQLLARNMIRNLPKLRPMILALSLSFALLYLGNAISSSINSGYSRTYQQFITADGTVAPLADRNFTVFGSDALLVGDYFVPPTFADFPSLEAALDSSPAVSNYSGIVTAAARVEIDGRGHAQPLFGVDFEDYRELLPDLSLIAGRFPAPGEAGILMNRNWVEERGGEGVLEIGLPVVITVAAGTSFTIRELPLLGVFEYPVSDPALDRVALIDVQSARALNGYIYGSDSSDLLDGIPGFGEEGSTGDVFGSVDDLFGSTDTLEEAESGITDPEDLFSNLPPAADSNAPETREGAWNFILIRLRDGYNMQDLNLEEDSLEPLVIRGWRQSAGGSAVLVWVLQLLFNAGLIFIAGGASIITVNALVLSVLERSKEIGTMRALGATKTRVGSLISAETILLVFSTGAVGVLIGTILVLLINAAGIRISNPVLISLFGRTTISGEISAALIGQHLLLGLLIGSLAMLYPLKKTLSITPVKAMTQQ
jgi:putative ABC transport system permease protein